MTDVEIIQGATLRVGDTEPNLRVRLIGDDGAPVNLSGATATLNVRKSDADSNKVDGGTMSLHDAETGIVEYDWSSSDTDTAGVFDAEVKIDDSGETSTYPNHRFFPIDIMEDLS